VRTLTRADIEALFENPEQGSLLISPQLLVEFMDGYWVRPDGKHVRMVELNQWDNGELMPVLVVSEPVAA